MTEKGILLFGTFPPPYGGVSVHLQYLSAYLVEKGYNVYVASYGDTNVTEEQRGVVIYRHRVSSLLLKKLASTLFKNVNFFSFRKYGFGLNEVINLALQRSLLDSIIKKHMDIKLISAYHSLPRGFVSTLVKEKYNIPVIVTIFGEIYSNSEYYLKRKKAVEFVINKTDILLSVSQHCAKSLEKLGLNSSHVKVIPYGIDIENFSPMLDKTKIRHKLGIQDEDKLILFVGRLDENTGTKTIIEMISLLLQQRNDVKVALVGARGELTQQAIEVAKRFKGKVFVDTDVPSQELPYYYAACDVFLAPTTDERACMGMTIKEAMACGKPVIAANVGGVPEAVIDGETGFLVNPNNPAELAQAVIKVLSAEHKKTELMVTNARIRAEDLFDKNKTNERICKIFEELIEQKGLYTSGRG